MDKEVVELYLDDIIPNRFQPREVFNQDALQELATSIKEHGIIQPIIVRKIGDKYEIIAGERRYKASTLAGLTKIPAIIRNLDDKEASKVALLENLQRRDLSPIEEARTYQKILEIDDMTQEALGKTMGKSQASIANKMRLLSLPDEVQEALLNEQISERHARSLLNIDKPEDQIKMLNKVIENRMTVRELDNEINGVKEPRIVDEVGPKVEIEALDDEKEMNITFESMDGDDEKEMDIKFESMDNLEVPNIIDDLPNKKYEMKDIISNIKSNVDRMRGKGFYIKTDEIDTDSDYEIVIRIEKAEKK